MIVDDLGQRGRLVADGEITHRYPVCWRCGTELIYRLVDEWFIRCDEIREPMIEAARGVEWTPPQYGKRMEDWLRNMGDWCISRKRYWGLPLPFYFCDDGHMTVIGSQAELLERAAARHRGARGAAPAVDRRRRHPLRRVRRGGPPPARRRRLLARRRASSRSRRSAGTTRRSSRPATPRARASASRSPTCPTTRTGRSGTRPTGCRRCASRSGSGSTRCSSWASSLDGRAPYRRVLTYEKVNDETGRPMHKSWGNAIWFEDAIEEMGADVMRWMYAAQPPAQNLNFGYGPAGDVKRRLLTLWNTYAFFVLYAGHRRLPARRYELLATGPDPAADAAARPLARRPHAGARRASAARRSTPTTRRGSCARSRRSWTTSRTGTCACRGRGSGSPTTRPSTRAAFETLWYALVQAMRCVAPVMPFLADEMWQNLVRGRVPDAPRRASTSPATPSRSTRSTTPDLVAAMETRADGRRARPPRPLDEANLKLRQPLREVIVATDDADRRRQSASTSS